MACAERSRQCEAIFSPASLAAGRARAWLLGATLCSPAGCTGIQSSLAPAGREAARIADLFWWMTAGALVIWVAVIALGLWCARNPSGPRRRDAWLIVGGGVVVPTVVLTALLVYGLAALPPLVARAPDGSLRIAVTGEQWWWRVQYLSNEGLVVEVANEIRLPVGEPVQFELRSDNVLHSFWIPSLGGKMDMIPGRVTYLTLQPTRTGVFRGACAEYCGRSHAFMAFYVEVLERGAFERWLDHQATVAQPPVSALAAGGRDLFLANGCSACHTVRGTRATGVLGPDLTHVGGRLSLAAGILENRPEEFAAWIGHPERMKPGVLMPRFGMLPRAHLDAIAAYLEALQ
jgi:cytochrome c oxidase subunit 2